MLKLKYKKITYFHITQDFFYAYVSDTNKERTYKNSQCKLFRIEYDPITNEIYHIKGIDKIFTCPQVLYLIVQNFLIEEGFYNEYFNNVKES